MASTKLYGPSIPFADPAVPPAQNVQVTNNAPLPASLITGTSTAEAMVNNPATAGKPLLVQIPSKSPLGGKTFRLEFSGHITTGGTTNVTLKLYSGTSETPGSNTLLGSSSTIAQNSASAPFRAYADLIFDQTSGKLTGTVSFLVNNTLVATVAVSNVVTGVSNLVSPVASFGLSFTCSAGFTTNAIVVDAAEIQF